MGYEDYFADFSDETKGRFSVKLRKAINAVHICSHVSPPWQVSPKSGTLNRRGGAPQVFEVEYSGGASGEAGHLIVMTEEEKWSYKLVIG